MTAAPATAARALTGTVLRLPRRRPDGGVELVGVGEADDHAPCPKSYRRSAKSTISSW